MVAIQLFACTNEFEQVDYFFQLNTELMIGCEVATPQSS
jgi:hypothetical protein